MATNPYTMPQGMLPMMLGSQILAGNQPRHYTQGPPNVFGSIAPAMMQYYQMQQELGTQKAAHELQQRRLALAEAAGAREEAAASSKLADQQQRQNFIDARVMDPGEAGPTMPFEDTPQTRLQMEAMGIDPGKVFPSSSASSPKAQTYASLIAQGKSPAEAFQIVNSLERAPKEKTKDYDLVKDAAGKNWKVFHDGREPVRAIPKAGEAPTKPDTALEKLQARRLELEAAVAADPQNPALQRDLADINSAIEKASTLVGRTAQDITSKTRGGLETQRAGVEQAEASIKSIIEIMKNPDLPTPTGVMGGVHEYVGGLLKQLPVIGDAVEGIGLHPGEVKRTRTRIRDLTTQLVRAMEEGGRYSEGDIARAEALNDGLSVFTDRDTYMQQLYELLTIVQERGTLIGQQLGRGEEKPAAPEVARPKSREDFNALPSGAKFIDPMGVERTKP